MKRPFALVFSIFLISSIVLLSSSQDSFGKEIVATSTGLENATVLEIKNMRGNMGSIDSVRIWTMEGNEFTSFKTEKGWMGKKQLNGVIEFVADSVVGPGENVKFGIKTVQENPIINWKAIDKDGNLLASGSASTSIKDSNENQIELNQDYDDAIKEDSRFRLIPEQPSADASFRLLGENFIPQQNVDFYIQDQFVDTIRIDQDGKILFTGKVPSSLESGRTEFILQDDSGKEKVLSLRVHDTEIRKTGQIIKLTMGNTPQEVKRGDSVSLKGAASPGITLTVTSKHADGQIIDINTIQVNQSGNWTFENIFPPDLNLGQISVEINDGKSKILRNFDVISSSDINIISEETKYETGETATFTGSAIPNKEISIILEDSIGTQVDSKSVMVGNSGEVSFDIEISKEWVEGTYAMFLYQVDEEEVVFFGVGQEPESIVTLKPVKINFGVDDQIIISIQGEANAEILVIVVDSSNREVVSESIKIGPDGKSLYEVDSEKLSTDAYTIIAIDDESTNEAKFSFGFSTGTGKISVQSTKTEYEKGESVLILGSADSKNIIISLRIIDPNGQVVRNIETFTDQAGFFNIDNFKIPNDAKLGVWKVQVKSGANSDLIEFQVKDKDGIFTIQLEKSIFSPNEIMSISGSGSSGSTITVKIINQLGEEISKLSFASKENGDYSSIWQIPADMLNGTYTISVNDGINSSSNEFTIQN